MIRVDMDTVARMMQEVADEHILPYFRNLKDGHIAFKIGDDPVTIADQEAEKALSTRLLDLLPGSKVVGEEGFASNPGSLNLLSGELPVWIIDPVDGTRNFVKGSSDFGVIIALAEQNQTIAGWIYDPTSKEVLSVEKGEGAWFKGQKLKVLPPDSLSHMRGFIGDRLLIEYEKSNISRSLQPVVEEMEAGAHEYSRLLVNGPHFGKVAKLQMHFRMSLFHCTPWDDAAGVLMHQEAGGYSAFGDGTPYRPSAMHRGLTLAPNCDSWHELKDWCEKLCKLPLDQA